MGQALNCEGLDKYFLEILEEIFEIQHGIFLDSGTSIFDTLKTVSAEKASQPVGGKCATLAAQVAHTAFFLEQAQIYIRSGVYEDADWADIWQNIHAVTPQEWTSLQENLVKVYRDTVSLLNNRSEWNEKTGDRGVLGIIAHSAYHLGEIRQALCALE